MVDLIIRMESQSGRKIDFSVEGIVLIDEIETHLHLELQRKILDLLTSIFPNIQFIMSTHSPFIINSVDNAVIYDLEKKILVKNGKRCIFRKNRALAPHERSAVPLGTDHCPVG